MTDVPSKHVWKIKESRIVFKDFDIIAVVPTFWIQYIFLHRVIPCTPACKLDRTLEESGR